MKPRGKIKPNSVHCSCCLRGMERMDSESVDLVVTSPPYDDLREYRKNSAWNHEFFKKTAAEMTRVLKPGGVIVWNVNDQVVNGGKTGSSFRQALFFMNECGLRLHDTMIYEKTGVAFASGPRSVRYTQKFEFVFILSKGKPKSVNLIQDKRNKWAGAQSWGNASARGIDGDIKKTGAKTKVVREFGVRNNIWLIKNSGGFGQKNKSAYKHPATMPEELARGHIISWSNPGDIVLDPFLGSGTTARVAKEEARKYIGFEIDSEYFALAKKMMRSTKKVAAKVDKPRQHCSFRNFSHAITRLRDAAARDTLNALEIEGFVRQFENTLEIAWNLLQDRLEYDGDLFAKIITPPHTIIEAAFVVKLIEDGDAWTAMISARDDMSHDYDTKKINKTMNNIRHHHLPALNALHQKFSPEFYE